MEEEEEGEEDDAEMAGDGEWPVWWKSDVVAAAVEMAVPDIPNMYICHWRSETVRVIGAKFLCESFFILEIKVKLLNMHESTQKFIISHLENGQEFIFTRTKAHRNIYEHARKHANIQKPPKCFSAIELVFGDIHIA